MPIFIDPDETKSSSLLSLPQAIECGGLEALTGADFVISRFPVPPSAASLKMHIEKRSLFVQRKSGYDICSFDQLKVSIARMKTCGIPMRQCALLPIGKYYADENGLLRVQGKRAYGEVTWQTYRKVLSLWGHRGGWVEPPLESEDELSQWIEIQLEALGDIEKEPKRELYPHRQAPKFQPDDVFQELTEVPSDDWRFFLCAGLAGFGPKMAETLQKYLEQEMPHLWQSGYHALVVLSEEDEQGKSAHNIRGWGEKSRQDLRNILALPKGYNLSIRETGGPEDPFTQGWRGALRAFRSLVEEEKMKGPAAWQLLMKQIDQFAKGETNE